MSHWGFRIETSWEDSYLRLWLNDKFLKENFSVEEQERIHPVNLTGIGDNGKESIDKVFLLSVDEVKKYCPHSEDATAFIPHILSVGNPGTKDFPIELDYNTYYWWTRTSGITKDLVVCVYYDGLLHEFDSNCDELGVRPAIWIKL